MCLTPGLTGFTLIRIHSRSTITAYNCYNVPLLISGPLSSSSSGLHTVPGKCTLHWPSLGGPRLALHFILVFLKWAQFSLLGLLKTNGIILYSSYSGMTLNRWCEEYLSPRRGCNHKLQSTGRKTEVPLEGGMSEDPDDGWKLPPRLPSCQARQRGRSRGFAADHSKRKKKVVLTLTFPPIRSGGSSSVSKATLMVAKGRLAICCISLSSC